MSNTRRRRYNKPVASASKARETMTAKLVDFLTNNPGAAAGNVPTHLRRFLRDLEKAGRIEYRSGGWYIMGAA